MRAQQLQLRTGTGRQKCQRHTAIVTHTLSAPGLKLAPAGWTQDGQHQQDHVAHRPTHRQKSTRRYALCLPNGVPQLPPTPPPPPTVPSHHNQNAAPQNTDNTPRSRPPTQRSAQPYHRRRSIASTPSVTGQGTPLEGVPERAMLASTTPALMMAQSTPLEGILERLQLPPRTIPRTVSVKEKAPEEGFLQAPAPSEGPVKAPPAHNDVPPLEDAPLCAHNNAAVGDADLPPLGDGMGMSDDDDHGHAYMDADNDDDEQQHDTKHHGPSPASMDAAASSPTTLGADPDSPNPMSGIRPRKSLGLSRFAVQQGEGGAAVDCALDSIMAGREDGDEAEEKENKEEGKAAVVSKMPKKSRKRRDLSPGNESMLQYAIKTPAPTNEGDGPRRSKRQKFPALRYWVNERKEYKRVHEAMPTVDVVVIAKTPSTAWKTVPDPLYRNRRKGG